MFLSWRSTSVLTEMHESILVHLVSRIHFRLILAQNIRPFYLVTVYSYH